MTVLLVVVWIANLCKLSVHLDIGFGLSCGVEEGLVGGVRWLNSNGPPGKFGFHVVENKYSSMRWIPTVMQTPDKVAVGVPCWLLLLVTFVSTFVAWRSDSRIRVRERAHLCPKCGYDRTGILKDAKCPECGAVPAGA